MSRSFQLPDLGEGIHEGEVLAILVSLGQAVREGDIILEVETDKAAVEIPSPYDGTVEEILVEPGDVVNVGDVMMTFNDGIEKSVDVQPSVTEKISAAPAAAEADASEAHPAHKNRPVPASPATRRIARELGVDLHLVTPSGPAGLVSADDVRSHAAASRQALKVPEELTAPTAVSPQQFVSDATVPPLPDFSKWGDIERVPFRSIRRATAKQMSLAWSQIPHVSSQDTIDITRLEAFRQKHKDEIDALGGKLTLTVFALKAVATALKTYPNFNATLDTISDEIIIKKYYHIGVAVNTNEGLIVPVVRDVDRKSIKDLSVELNELVNRTRARKTKLEQMQGGSFTITNAGAMGGGFFSPIINYPEVAILGMGQARLQPTVMRKIDNKHEILPRLIMPIVLCIDHRVLDGADAIRFLKVIVETLEDPDELLMSMI
jgi:pyruvate dehydrogenase E2 component (dihydrolipoamide acetyltransferase)